MSEDPHLGRFMIKLTFFSTFMFILLLSNNFVQFLLGWEGVGISSYLLINFWFGRVAANRSAFQAIILNRIGDFGLMLGIISLYFIFYTWDFEIIFNLSYLVINTNYFILFGYKFSILHFGLLFLLLGVIGKSAQIGLHMWLPAAMEGPTPVSALIHSSTMVVAGVYLVIRVSKLFEIYPFISILICFIGALTVLLASFLGIIQYDIKKVIAYSTCSQLGYMLFACGTYNYIGSVFHLLTHAFFKSLLFLCAGCIVHVFLGEQDIRYMGGLRNKMPGTFTIMLIGILTLNGIFFLSSFYSKEVILMVAYSFNNYYMYSMFLLVFFSLSLTSFYSFRLLYFIFFERPQVPYVKKVIETDYISFFCISILSFFSIVIGFFLEDNFVGLGTTLWQNSISISFNGLFEIEFMHNLFQYIPILLLFWGLYFFYLFEIYIKSLTFFRIFTFEIKSFGWDGVYKFLSFWLILFNSYSVFFKLLDRGFFELIEFLFLIRYFYEFDFIIFLDNILNSVNLLLFIFFIGIFLLSFILIYFYWFGIFFFNIFLFIFFCIALSL
jgi:proton-translocating NADH-quinone oxidoreductase chain L